MKLVVRSVAAAAVWIALGACGKVGGEETVDAEPSVDAAIDAAPPADANPLGTSAKPAKSCAELRAVLGPVSGVYWVEHPDGASAPFQVYCEQELGQGGWAMLFNSVLREDGTTTAFWKIRYVDRFNTKGTAAPDENYYQGGLYLIGEQYMDVFVDLTGKAAIAAIVQTTGIDQETMKLQSPALTSGNGDVFNAHFASGWSSFDKDLDAAPAPEPDKGNCAVIYSEVTQHYANCWNYNLGSDADQPLLDDGVGPHVHSGVLRERGLSVEDPADATDRYSRVSRIARFTRW